MTNEKDNSKNKSVDDTKDIWRLDPHTVDLYVEEMEKISERNAREIEERESQNKDSE